MEIYLVGGAVRDRLLDLPVKERDWVVVGATPEQMLELGYKQVGKDFPVFLHPETGDEYALARTERKTGPGYKGFEFHASPDVTLEDDLLRRDLTINAMAQAPDGSLIDPHHGADDLREGLLRHVSPAFAEDPVRILRVARLAARFGKWGFRVAHGTNALMRTMVENGEIDHLVPERVWAELAKALDTDTPHIFFQVLRGCGALSRLFPEIDREFPAITQAHADREVPQSLEALRDSTMRSDDPRVRFAVLLHALGHDLSAAQRLDQAEALCTRYRAPNDYTRLALNAIRLEQQVGSDDAKQILEFMESAGSFRQPAHFRQLLEVYAIAGLIDETRTQILKTASERSAAVSAAQIDDTDVSGPALGEAIRERRAQIIRGILATAG
jgi:tRNA nucleotidyltransferase (CCA-adding enzyme)